MSTLSNFLNDGKSSVSTVPTSSTTETVLPDWYTNYAMDILANQQAVANNPYVTYQGPRVAALTDQQKQAFAQAGNVAGTQGALTQAQPYMQQGAQNISQSTNQTGINMAQPYLTQAGQSTAGQVGSYMNPYTDAVVDRIGDLGARQLREKFLPEISDRFVGAGQFGGSRQAEMIGRALRDTSESTLAQQTQALQQGYTQASDIAQGDLARQAQLAGTAGNIGQNQQQALLSAGTNLANLGSTYGNLAEQQQRMGLTGISALQNAGQLQQDQNQKNLDVAYQDFLKQQANPQTQLNALTGTLQGVQGAIPQGKMTSGIEAVNGSTGPSSASTLASAVATALGVKNLIAP